MSFFVELAFQTAHPTYSLNYVTKETRVLSNSRTIWMNHFSIYQDKSVAAITTFVIILILSLTVIFYYLTKNNLPNLLYIIYPLLYLPGLITFLYTPFRYVVNGNDITIIKPVGNTTIIKKGITHVKQIISDDLGLLIRKFGSGGLFGYFGLFGSLKTNLVLLILDTDKKTCYPHKIQTD